MKNGAAAVSCLTDPRFQGELEHLAQIKREGASGRAPVLRKDFIIDPYQLYEARAAGADGVLLIVAILSPDLLASLLEEARSLWMQCLVEVHDEAELATAVDAGAEIIGINNRDLHTFTTDLGGDRAAGPAGRQGAKWWSARAGSSAGRTCGAWAGRASTRRWSARLW